MSVGGVGAWAAARVASSGRIAKGRRCMGGIVAYVTDLDALQWLAFSVSINLSQETLGIEPNGLPNLA
jgi:hypothetical protein